METEGEGETPGTSAVSLSSTSAGGASSPSEEVKAATAQLGRTVVDDVLVPVIERLSSIGGKKGDELDVGAADLEALEMIRKGFEELKGSNPALAWRVVEGVLGGVNECVLLFFSSTFPSPSFPPPIFTPAIADTVSHRTATPPSASPSR